MRRHAWIEGRVQGVWFRHHTVEAAKRAGVAGWVRNAPDGRVEAVFEGIPEAVERLIAWCEHGPPRARVDSVTVVAEDPEGLPGFEVRA